MMIITITIIIIIITIITIIIINSNNRLSNKKTITIKFFKYKTKIIGSTPNNQNRLNGKLNVPLK